MEDNFYISISLSLYIGSINSKRKQIHIIKALSEKSLCFVFWVMKTTNTTQRSTEVERLKGSTSCDALWLARHKGVLSADALQG